MRAENNEPVRAATTVDAMARFRSTSVSDAIAVNPTSSPMLCASRFRPRAAYSSKPWLGWSLK